jgi:hypothetical protein
MLKFNNILMDFVDFVEEGKQDQDQDGQQRNNFVFYCAFCDESD